jgi:hypothetical protein
VCVYVFVSPTFIRRGEHVNGIHQAIKRDNAATHGAVQRLPRGLLVVGVLGDAVLAECVATHLRFVCVCVCACVCVCVCVLHAVSKRGSVRTAGLASP